MKDIRQPGFTLIECLVYMALLFMVTGMATAAFFHFWDNHKAFTRNADAVVRVLHVGDQWRADIRSAQGPIQSTLTNGAEQLRIPSGTGEIVYTFARGELHRQSAVLLSGLKSSQMQSNDSGHVPAWHWDLELQSKLEIPRWRPLFTFEAVAGPARTP